MMDAADLVEHVCCGVLLSYGSPLRQRQGEDQRGPSPFQPRLVLDLERRFAAIISANAAHLYECPRHQDATPCSSATRGPRSV